MPFDCTSVLDISRQFPRLDGDAAATCALARTPNPIRIRPIPASYVMQQPERINPVPVILILGPRKLHGPAELIAYSIGESLYFPGSRMSFGLKDFAETELLIPITEPGFARRAKDERHNDCDEQRNEVLDEERAAWTRALRFHWMTLLARNKMEEIFKSIPSSLAVFRLTASSNFSGCTTGRAAGLSPRNILSA